MVADDARAAEVPRLTIEDGYLVARVDRCTCEPHYGAHEIHCGIVDHHRLDNLPGWPGTAETTTEDDAKVPAHVVDAMQRAEQQQREHGGDNHKASRDCSECRAIYEPAETATATDEDAAQVMDDVIQHLRKIWSTGHDEAREVIDTAEELLSQALPRLLATARTRPTREQIAKALDFHFTESDYHDGCALRCGYDGDERDMHLADAVLALWADRETTTEDVREL